MNSKKVTGIRKRSCAAMAVLLALLLTWMTVPVFSAFADINAENGAADTFADTYCATWAEYQEASGKESASWNDVVDAMDQVLLEGIRKFEAGDLKAAYDCVNNDYYGYYETTGFERIAMGYISGSRKTEMELQFAACKAVCKQEGSLDDFKAECEKLSEMLREDANKLDGVSGNSSSESEDSSNSLAAQLFADNYYGTWAEYQEASGLEKPTWNDVVDAMDQTLETAKSKFYEGDLKAAYDCVNNAYYGYYETTGFERIAMGYISGSRKTEMELQFSACKAVCKQEGSIEDFEAECDTLSAMLREDANKLDGTTGNSSTEEDTSSGQQSSGGRSAAAAVFIACFTIILREGFEAILVVGAIVAYLLKTKDTDSKLSPRPVYAGAILGIVASFISAWLLNQLKLANSASQEIIEGVTALIAVVVLFWVSNWMVSKSESEAWTRYIKSKVESSARSGSVFALAFTAFLAVYREGAEVILFFQPMLAGDHIDMVWVGFIVGCISLVFVYIAIRVLSLRLPLKPLFLGTSILMFIMSISFLGAGIKELIEGDVITMTASPLVSWIPSNPVLEVLGIFPCDQTIFAQLIMLVIVIIVWIWHMRKNKKLREEVAAAKAAEEEAAKAAEEHAAEQQ